MSDYEKLKTDLTRLVDDCPCPYEQVIKALLAQVKWLKKARKQEHGG